MNHVIISEKKDKRASKYMLKDLPFPYTSAAQHEQKLRTPMGPEWSTSTVRSRLFCITSDVTMPALCAMASEDGGGAAILRPFRCAQSWSRCIWSSSAYAPYGRTIAFSRRPRSCMCRD